MGDRQKLLCYRTPSKVSSATRLRNGSTVWCFSLLRHYQLHAATVGLQNLPTGNTPEYLSKKNFEVYVLVSNKNCAKFCAASKITRLDIYLFTATVQSFHRSCCFIQTQDDTTHSHHCTHFIKQRCPLHFDVQSQTGKLNCRYLLSDHVFVLLGCERMSLFRPSHNISMPVPKERNNFTHIRSCLDSYRLPLGSSTQAAMTSPMEYRLQMPVVDKTELSA